MVLQYIPAAHHAAVPEASHFCPLRYDQSVSWTEVFDAIESDALHDLALLAREVVAAPIALVTLADNGRYWFTSLIGATTLPDVPWEKTFCAHAIQDTSIFVVPDATRDHRFAHHPLVCAAPAVRFYAGAPLVADGQVLGTLCVMDMEPRELSEEARVALRALARQVVMQLKLRLQARQLTALKTEIEYADANRRELMANVSHDLRTPLTALRGYLDTVLLKDDTLNALTRCHLEQSLKLSAGAARLVAELFELTQLDTAGADVRRERFPLAELTRDVVQSFTVLAGAKNIDLRLSASDPSAMVEGDVRLLERVLWNLLDNALRFTPWGGTVDVSCEQRDMQIIVRVRDSGLGIPTAEYERVFNRFYRGQTVTSDRHSAGLGLSIARRIIDLHHGQIRAWSPPGGGAQFEFSLACA